MNTILNKLGRIANTARATAHFPLDVIAARETKNRLSKLVSQAADHLTRPIGPEYRKGLESTEKRFGPTLFEPPEKLIRDASEISGDSTPERQLTRGEKTREVMGVISRFVPENPLKKRSFEAEFAEKPARAQKPPETPSKS